MTTKTINVIKIIAKTCFLAMIFTLFGYCSKQSTLNTKSITYVYSFQFFTTDSGKLVTWKDSVNIYYRGNYILFAIPHRFEKTRVNTGKNGNYIGETILKNEIWYSYLMYPKGDMYGSLKDSLTSSKPRKVLVDSVLKFITYSSFPFYMSDNDILLRKTINEKTGTAIEKHIYKERKTASYPDSINYYFNKDLNNIDFSFSKLLDSTRRAKLVRVELITNPSTDSATMKTIPRRTISFEIKNNSSDTSINEVLFDRLKNSINAHKKGN